VDALILYVSIGSGHRRAAEVLAETFSQQLGWCCHTADFLATLSPRLPNLANNLNAWMLKFAASTYDQYWADDVALKPLDHLLVLTDLLGVVRDLLHLTQPALCVCTHALPARILSLLWQRDGRSRPTLNVLTDFMVNGLWPVDQMTAFVVASAASQRQLFTRGFPLHKIYPLGIPVAARFAAAVEPPAFFRRKLNLADKPTLLAITGGLRRESYAQIAQTMQRLFHHWATAGTAVSDWQVIVITGHNQESLDSLRLLTQQLPFSVVLLPFVPHIEEWMAASDVLLTKPGGLTVAEALTRGLPLLLTGVGPGQEKANARLLTKTGCALEGDQTIHGLAEQVAGLLANPARLEAMRQACRALAQPQAAQKIAGLAQTIMQNEVQYE